MADNPVRPCWGCSTFDDHPRHVLVRENGTDEEMHVDCCAEKRGCGICRSLIADVTPGTVGDDMRAHLLAQAPAQVIHDPNDDTSDPYNLTTAVVSQEG